MNTLRNTISEVKLKLDSSLERTDISESKLKSCGLRGKWIVAHKIQLRSEKVMAICGIWNAEYNNNNNINNNNNNINDDFYSGVTWRKAITKALTYATR